MDEGKSQVVDFFIPLILTFSRREKEQTFYDTLLRRQIGRTANLHGLAEQGVPSVTEGMGVIKTANFFSTSIGKLL